MSETPTYFVRVCRTCGEADGDCGHVQRASDMHTVETVPATRLAEAEREREEWKENRDDVLEVYEEERVLADELAAYVQHTHACDYSVVERGERSGGPAPACTCGLEDLTQRYGARRRVE